MCSSVRTRCAAVMSVVSIRVAVGKLLVARGRRLRLCTGGGVGARWMSVVVVSVSGEMRL